MNGFVREMENAFVAVSFSEIGEHGIALEFLAAPAASTRPNAVAENSGPYTTLTPEGNP